jgi:DNA-directed RNA polymerase beta' subunit
MINGLQFQFFPRSRGMTMEMKSITSCFEQEFEKIKSPEKNLSSNQVLEIIRPHLENIGFTVETGKSRLQKINIPVLFGIDSTIDKSFNADAVSNDGKIVIEVEAGRATENNQFLKDIFQACMMFEVEYLVIVVRNEYRGHKDFEIIYTFLETLYISSRLHLPLKGILLIGY